MRKKIREAALVRGKVHRGDDGHLSVWIPRIVGAAFIFQSRHSAAGILALLQSALLHPVWNLWEHLTGANSIPVAPDTQCSRQQPGQDHGQRQVVPRSAGCQSPLCSVPRAPHMSHHCA